MDGGGPTYRAVGRMIRGSANCSMMWADHPTIRLRANVGVKSSAGTPTASSTIEA